ncbi:MAG: CFI-box-CTERM domain-containing protein [bacterium]|nr:CFI-box-CTERM domain-containing protein [bacterium]
MDNKMEEMRILIENSDLSEHDKAQMLQNIMQIENQKINLLITGATGCGKSSTINALFGENVAKVGCTPDPETMEIERFDLGNLILWDSPGLGDGKEADNRHAKNIIKKLNQRDSDGNLLIDLVLVILDGGSRDLGTSYQLINEVIIPNLGDDKDNRLLIAINQADVAMKGRYWDYENNVPEQKLIDFLNEKAKSVKERIKEATGVTVDPIYYSAGFKEDGEEQTPPYNLSKLLYYIVRKTPKKKRLVYTQHINQDTNVWKDSDELKDYTTETQKSLVESITDGMEAGAEIGGAIGSIFGRPGEAVGRVVGGVIGGGAAIVKKVGEIFNPFPKRPGRIGGGGGGCYITTAVCNEYGKPDNCYELTQFRSFRDNWLAYQPDGQELIERYYKTAPAIVSLINKQANHADIYRQINDNYLTKCLKYIENGENEKCKALYIDMVERLYKEQVKWQ